MYGPPRACKGNRRNEVQSAQMRRYEFSSHDRDRWDSRLGEARGQQHSAGAHLGSRSCRPWYLGRGDHDVAFLTQVVQLPLR